MAGGSEEESRISPKPGIRPLAMLPDAIWGRLSVGVLLLTVGLMEEVQEWAKQTRAPVKHLARMLVAWRIGCPWCLDFGTSTSEKLGVTDEQLCALPDYEHSSLFSEEERAVLRYADAMTRTPVRVPDAVFEALKARYTDRQILEMTAAIAWENYRARFDHAFGIESGGFSAGTLCPLPAAAKTR